MMAYTGHEPLCRHKEGNSWAPDAGALQVTDPDRRLNYYLGDAGNREKRLGNRGEGSSHLTSTAYRTTPNFPGSDPYEYLGKRYQSQGRSDMEVEYYKAALAPIRTTNFCMTH